MATPKWEPGKLYPPGSLVVPRTTLPPGPVQVSNGGFDTDADDWVLNEYHVDATLEWSATGGYQSAGCIRFTCVNNPIPTGEGLLATDALFPVKPGQQITAQAMARIISSPGNNGGCRVFLIWYDQDGNIISSSPGANALNDVGGYRIISCTASAPLNAVGVRPSVSFNGGIGGVTEILLDNFSWNYVSPGGAGLQYRAVQSEAGFSGSSEPLWPPTLGQQVTDNEVIWEAVSISRLVWEAEPILKSGLVEPSWPSNIGDAVVDNTISWVASDPIIADPNCPRSKVVVIAKFKVFAGDKDIVRYSATANPADWTSEKDAGFLGTGVQQNGANHVAAMGLYRGNLIPMNATTAQQWFIDPDPALMDLLDTLDGIGSIWHLAMTPVGDDLLYLSNQGVRSLGVTGQSNNLRSGDVGMPVDPIVKALTRELVERNIAGENEQPISTYWPSMGEYWLCFNRIAGGDDSDERVACPTLNEGDRYAEVMVYSMSQVGQVGAWSRYIFPFAIDAWTQEGDDLYVRDGDTVYRISDEIGACDKFVPADGEAPAEGVPFNAVIQWPWLDLDAPGSDKQVEAFDIVGYGRAKVEIGYDQAEPGYFTPPYEVDPDTLRGTPVPIPVTAPSISVRIRYDGWDPVADEGNKDWGFNAFALYYT